MPIRFLVTRSSLIAMTFCWLAPSSAQAGPLLEWLFGGFNHRQPPAYPVGPAQPVGGAPSVGAYYGASMPVIGRYGYGYAAQSPVGIAAATLPQPTVSYVPDYRTSYYRAPVTYYRPIMTTDPTTGSQIVTLAPCTSYEYQTQRIPTWGSQPLMNTYGLAPAYVRPTAPIVPTYTLPSGGIPLAGSIPSSQYATGYQAYSPNYGSYPNSLAPYSTGYGSYSALQPPLPGQPGAIPASPGTALTAPPSATAFPTSPYGTPGGYYGSGSGGGSCGNYAAPMTVPGLVAPYPGTFAPGPTSSFPAPTQNTYPVQPTNPGMVPSTLPIGPVPSPSQPSGSFSNPADPNAPPVLPPVTGQSSARLDPRPYSQNPAGQPFAGSERTSNSASREENRSSSAPLMMPIPLPEKFKHEPRWNPGLLKEGDQTAQNSRAANAVSQEELWGSKPIKWASFTNPVATAVDSQATRQPLATDPPTSGLRPIARQRQSQPIRLPANENAQKLPSIQSETLMVPLTANPQPNLPPILELSPTALKHSTERIQVTDRTEPAIRKSRYNTGGWQATR